MNHSFLLEEVLQGSSSCIFVVNELGNYLWFNNNYSSFVLSRYSQSPEIGSKMLRVFNEIQNQKIDKAILKSFSRISTSFTQSQVKTDPNSTSLEFHFYPIQNEDAKTAVVCKIEDVTERIKYERQKYINLRVLFEKRLNGFSKIIPDFILISDNEGNRKFANKSYCDFFQLSEQEVIEQNYYSLIPIAEREAYYSKISQISIDKPSITHVHQLLSPNGEQRWTLWNETATFDHNGNFIELLSIGRNVDKMIRAKQIREEYIQVLEQTIFKASHEVRQPISNILGLAQILEKDNYDDNELEDIVDFFRESANKLDIFTKELTEFIHNSIERNTSPQEH